MNSNKTAYYLVLAVGVVALAVAVDLLATGRATAPPSLHAGYPPPISSPTPTASPDPSGYFPPPSDVPSETTTIAASHFPQMLAQLQSDLDSANATDIAIYMASDGYGGVHVASSTDPQGATQLSQVDAEQVLTDYFDDGAAPVIQGYFVWPYGNSTCALVLIAGWQGEAAVPGATMTPLGGLESISDDAFKWDVCADGSDISITGWMTGYYHQLVSGTHLRRQSTYMAIQP